MIETILLAMIVAKLKGFNPSKLFKAWPIYPIIILELTYVIFQTLILSGNYSVIKYSNFMEKPLLILFLILILLYKQYISAIIGSAFIVIGGVLNNIVIAANNGKMPVFPTISYLTGYVRPEMWVKVNDIHTLGTSATKLKFLADIFDVGYCIMSIGDIFIRVFVFLIIYNTIKKLNIIKTSSGVKGYI